MRMSIKKNKKTAMHKSASLFFCYNLYRKIGETMKKLGILLVVLCMLFGCTSKQDKDDVYRCAKTMATGFIENSLGYDTNAKYVDVA